MRLPAYEPLLLHQRERGNNGGCGASSMTSRGDGTDDSGGEKGCTTIHGKPYWPADSASGSRADGEPLPSTMATTVPLRAQAEGEAADDAAIADAIPVPSARPESLLL